WQSIDPLAVVRRLGDRIGFVHGKDTVLDPERVRLDGVLDRTAWRYATVGHGHDVVWWRSLLAELRAAGYDGVVSIEYEDPLVPPDRGKVFLDDREVTRLQPRDRDVAMVFQSYALYPHMTVRENIDYPLKLREVSKPERARAVQEVAELLEIGHLLDRRPRQL